MASSEFTLQDALNVQLSQVIEWSKKLNPAIYADLLTALNESNQGKTDPYSINRGVDIDTFINNWSPEERTNLRRIHGLTYLKTEEEVK